MDIFKFGMNLSLATIFYYKNIEKYFSTIKIRC